MLRIVVAKGDKVTQFKSGDRVIAVSLTGGYAEYALANESHVALKPSNTSFEEATSLVVNIGTAQSVLFNEGKLAKGQKVLIQGAAGATGATMVQMAKNAGAYVIATASGQGIPLVKSLGADEVIDYRSQNVSAAVRCLTRLRSRSGLKTASHWSDRTAPGKRR